MGMLIGNAPGPVQVLLHEHTLLLLQHAAGESAQEAQARGREGLRETHSRSLGSFHALRSPVGQLRLRDCLGTKTNKPALCFSSQSVKSCGHDVSRNHANST